MGKVVDEIFRDVIAVLPLHWLWWTENRENLSKGSRCPVWGSNHTFPDYVSEALALGSAFWIAALVVKKKCILHQGWLNLGRRIVVMAELVVRNVCGPTVWKLLRVTSLAPIILSWLLEFWKIFAPLFLISVLFILARPRIPLGHLVIHLCCTVFNTQLHVLRRPAIMLHTCNEGKVKHVFRLDFVRTSHATNESAHIRSVHIAWIPTCLTSIDRMLLAKCLRIAFVWCGISDSLSPTPGFPFLKSTTFNNVSWKFSTISRPTLLLYYLSRAMC